MSWIRTTVGDIANHPQQEEQVQLDIAERFSHLISFQVLVLDPRLVASQPLDHDSLLPQSQALSRDRAVREENVHDNAPDAAQSANDKELELPARQPAIDVPDSETKQTSQSDAEAVGEIPRPHGTRLLGTLWRC